MLDVAKILGHQKLVAVIRRMDEACFPYIVEALIEGGICTLEITMDGTGAAQQISGLRRQYGNAIVIGAGTVTELAQVRCAVAAGADFLVSPHLDLELVEEGRRLGVPLIPGTFSPTDIATAVRAGVTTIKVFPADTLGPDYIRHVLGPFHGIHVMATGGVSELNLLQFLRAGVTAVGLGSNLFPKSDLIQSDWKAIRERAQRLLKAVHNVAGRDERLTSS